jgi:peptidoglycan/xylan/chitin deacetylase (PgdA/CDA1 family)
MILVLTYHQVCDTPPGQEPNFYTVTPAQFDHQIHLLQESGFVGVRVEELLQSAALVGKRALLSFDDGTADHYKTVFPLLRTNQAQGVFFVPTASLNQPGYLSAGQVKEMAAAGQVIGLHGHEHRRMDTMSEAEIRRQFALSQKIIGDITETKPVVFAPPGGFVNDRVRQVCRESGVRLIRTMRWGYNEKSELMALETMPVNRHMTERKFRKRLESRTPPLLYAGKETLKKLVPLPVYERMRKVLFRFSKSN